MGSTGRKPLIWTIVFVFIALAIGITSVVLSKPFQAASKLARYEIKDGSMTVGTSSIIVKGQLTMVGEKGSKPKPIHVSVKVSKAIFGDQPEVTDLEFPVDLDAKTGRGTLQMLAPGLELQIVEVVELPFVRAADLTPGSVWIEVSDSVNRVLQRIDVTNLKTHTFDRNALSDSERAEYDALKRSCESFGCNRREYLELMDDIPADLRRITLAEAKYLAETLPFNEAIDMIRKIHRVPDFEGGSGLSIIGYRMDPATEGEIMIIVQLEIIEHLKDGVRVQLNKKE